MLTDKDIFDLAGNKWYTQNATGDIPEPRHRFCGGIATAEDGSSSNMYGIHNSSLYRTHQLKNIDISTVAWASVQTQLDLTTPM